MANLTSRRRFLFAAGALTIGADICRAGTIRPEQVADMVDAERYRKRLQSSQCEKADPRHPLHLTVQGRREVVGPTERELLRAIDALTPLGGPGYLALEAPGVSYLQAAGGHGMYTAECRESLGGNFESFRHYVAASEGNGDRLVRIATNGYGITVRENECLDVDDVKEIMVAYLRTQERAEGYEWHDISDRFERAIVRI